MRTKAFVFLTLVMLILPIPVSSVENHKNNSYSTPLSNMITSTEATSEQSTSPDMTITVEKNINKQSDITAVSASPSSSSSPSSAPSTSPTTNQLNQLSSTKTPDPSKPSDSKLMLIVILLAIVVLMLFVGCLHAMRDWHSGQDSSVPRLLLGVRERLRTMIITLEDRMGLHLCTWANGGGEGDEDEAEGAQRRDDRGEGAGHGVKNEEKGEHKGEDSYSSDDYSSMEGDNLRERVLSKQEEEERKQSGNEDGEETGSVSEGDQCAVVGESIGDKKGGSEEIALVSSPQEDDRKADLCDVTVL